MQWFNFTGNPAGNPNGNATMFFIIEEAKKKKKTILDFSQGIVKNCNVILF